MSEPKCHCPLLSLYWHAQRQRFVGAGLFGKAQADSIGSDAATRMLKPATKAVARPIGPAIAGFEIPRLISNATKRCRPT